MFAPSRQQQARSRHLPAFTGVFDVPSSPGIGTLFETPIAPRAGKERLNVVDDTPIKSRLPLGVAGDGVNRAAGALEAKEKATARRENGGSDSADSSAAKENGSVSIYQQLGWEATDLDDIDDLL